MSYYNRRNTGLARWHVAIITFVLTSLLCGKNPIDVATGAFSSIATQTTTTTVEAE